MAKIDDLTVLTENEPIPYESKLLVYFIFNHSDEPIVLTTRFVAEKQVLIDWFTKAKEDKEIKIVVVWPGQYRSEAFVCNPEIALKAFGK